MKPVETELTNMVFKAPEGMPECNDLPVRDLDLGDTNLLESCWELDDEDIETIIRDRKIYLGILGQSHPVVCLGVSPLIIEGGLNNE